MFFQRFVQLECIRRQNGRIALDITGLDQFLECLIDDFLLLSEGSGETTDGRLSAELSLFWSEAALSEETADGTPPDTADDTGETVFCVPEEQEAAAAQSIAQSVRMMSGFFMGISPFVGYYIRSGRVPA